MKQFFKSSESFPWWLMLIIQVVQAAINFLTSAPL